MATNANLDVTWSNVEILTENGAENKKVLVDPVDNKIYTIKDYIPKRINKSFLKPSYIILCCLIIVLIIIIGVISHDLNSRSDVPKQDYLYNTNVTNILESAYDDKHDTNEKYFHEKNFKETTMTTEDNTAIYSTIDSTTKEENLLSTYEPNEEENDTINEILLFEENKIWSFELNSQKLTLFYESEHVIKALVIYSNETLFLSEENKIVSLNKKENQTQINVNLIFEEPRVNPKAMAMDFINNNLYIVDELMGGLIVINTVTKYYSLLLMDLKAPRFIAIDSSKAILFIVTSESIIKGNLDGTSLRSIFSGTDIDTITLDKIRENIYWIQDFQNIMRSDYAGLNLKKILADHTSIAELIILGKRLFWLRLVDGISATLWSCNITDDNCNDHSLHYSEALKNPKVVRGASGLDRVLKQQPLSVSRKCDHLSLTMPNGQISCVCNMGSQLVYNKSCQPYQEFGLYTFGDTIRARFLDNTRPSSVELIWPTPYTVESLTYKNSIDFDYDLKNDHFYFSDDSKIYQMKIKGKHSNQTVILESEESYIQNLVYDWFTGNLYYIHRQKQTNKYYIGILNVASNAVKSKLTSFTCSNSGYNRGYNYGYESNICVVCGLALSASRGYLFFISKIGDESRVYRYTMNSGNVVMIYNTRYLSSYAVDFIKNILYYISSENSEVNHINFNGTGRSSIAMNYLRGGNIIKSMSVDKQWIYLNFDDSVWKLHKKTREQIRMMQVENGLDKTYGSFKVISQPEDNKNPCRNNNGGCEQFCFIGSKPTCGCGDNFTLTSDNLCMYETKIFVETTTKTVARAELDDYASFNSPFNENIYDA